MRIIKTILMFLFSVQLSSISFATNIENDRKIISASGTFEVQLDPQKDDYAPAGRMVISKKYTGGLAGDGAGQMLSKRTDNGVSVYTAIEEFNGNLDGKAGSFTLIHNGYMTSESQSLEIKILEGSGTGELKNIKGELTIVQEDGAHKYKLVYEL